MVSRYGARGLRELTRQDPRDPDAHHFFSVCALDERHVWACGAQGEDDTGVLWRSTDGGAFWEVLMAGDRARGLEPGVMYTQVHFTDTQRGFLVSAGEAMLTTVDGGRSWRAVHVMGATPFGLHFLDARRGWMVSHDLDARRIPVRTRLFGTHDGGLTWRPEVHDFAGLDALDVAGLHVDRDGTALLCGPGGMLLWAQMATHGVTRWHFARGAVADDLNCVARSPDGAYWVAGECGVLLVSRDGGRTFAEVPAQTRRDLHALAFVPDAMGRTVGFAFGDRGTILRFDPSLSDVPMREAAPWP
jgi:photosystem II stability/assembly factor-like uncharacterized protein